MIAKTLTAALAASFLLVAPVAAQNNNTNVGGGKGLVVVNLNLLEDAQIDILRGANIEFLNDNQVAVPITVAAILCNTEVNLIASSNDRGDKTCDAQIEGVQNFENR